MDSDQNHWNPIGISFQQEFLLRNTQILTEPTGIPVELWGRIPYLPFTVIATFGISRVRQQCPNLLMTCHTCATSRHSFLPTPTTHHHHTPAPTTSHHPLHTAEHHSKTRGKGKETRGMGSEQEGQGTEMRGTGTHTAGTMTAIPPLHPTT